MTELTQGGRRVHSIATRYNGTLFRSALEAKWAKALDLLWIEWEYEPEAILLSNGVTYLPDFRLPRVGQFIEVKPDAFLDKAAIDKMARLCEVASRAAPTILRPEFQAVWCSEAGKSSAFGCAAGEPYTKVMLLERPLLLRCLECNAVYFSSGVHRIYEGLSCHVCGSSGREFPICGDRREPYYGVYNG